MEITSLTWYFARSNTFWIRVA